MSIEHPRPPGTVIVVVVLAYVAGVIDILLGILLILLRYADEIEQDGDQRTVTLLGAGMILFGLLTIALASGLTRGRRGARMLVTVALAGSLLLGLVSLVSDAISEPGSAGWSLAGVLLTGGAIAALWFGSAGRFFAKH